MTLMNVDPYNSDNLADPPRLIELGFGGVRLVCRPGVEDYIQHVQSAGLFVLGAITPESQGNMLGGICDAYQIGNEPDSYGDSSATLSAPEYIEAARIYRETYPTLTMIGAGLASGNVNYWKSVGPSLVSLGYQGFAVHPYNKKPSEAEALLKRYQAVTPTLPLWVTEWHRPASEIPAWKAMLRRVGVVSDAWFCYGWDQWALAPEHARAMRA